MKSTFDRILSRRSRGGGFAVSTQQVQLKELFKIPSERQEEKSEMKRYLSVALVLLLLLAFFSSKYSIEGRYLLRMTHSSQAVRDFQTSKDMKNGKPLGGENDSFRRRVPRSGSNPLQNK
ncbi:unnamed protein product [Eruca vesicaria subsp. sativa]|uniref:Uncharacterized protein n=1 Tax=Eruca vesicaria subsp. sativa TaxID=29727 RepID=A0ABC8LC41_ERUVS|nr:unnamed protein product [Eruca vesicaria subsp. sativa]